MRKPSLVTTSVIVNKGCCKKEMMSRVPELEKKESGSRQQLRSVGACRKHQSGPPSQSKSQSMNESTQGRIRSLQPKENLPKKQEIQSSKLGLLEADDGDRRRNFSKERCGDCTRRSRNRSRGGSKGRRHTG